MRCTSVRTEHMNWSIALDLRLHEVVYIENDYIILTNFLSSEKILKPIPPVRTLRGESEPQTSVPPWMAIKPAQSHNSYNKN